MFIDEKLFYKVSALFVELKKEYYSILCSIVIFSLLQFVCTEPKQGVFLILSVTSVHINLYNAKMNTKHYTLCFSFTY